MFGDWIKRSCVSISEMVIKKQKTHEALVTGIVPHCMRDLTILSTPEPQRSKIDCEN